MSDLAEYEQDSGESENNDEDIDGRKSEENLKNFRELLMRENINIVAKLKKYKATDFRKKLVLNQLKELKKLSELSKIWVSVPYVEQSFGRSVITVDSSKAGSNIDSLRLAVNDLGWKEYPNGRSQKSCHVVWNSCSFTENRNNSGAFVNKFPGISQCLHKVGFSRILETMRSLFPDQYSFYPLTWYLPHQMADFTMYCKNREAENKREKYYIVKPDNGTQGDGIYLIRRPHEYKMSSRSHVVQEYLDSPLLLDGYKFDLRIYVVLISLDPLRIYLCNDGLARFCTHKYCHPTITNHGNSFMHLTNYSLNKKSNQFIHTQNVDTGSKRTMSSVLAALEANGCDVSTIWKKLEELVYKTMLAIVPQLKVHYVTEVLVKSDNVNMKTDKVPVEERPNCFQILGFDVLIMENLQPVLLEVNSNPSLRLDCEMEIAPGISEYYLSKVDVRIKRPLVKHTLQLLEQEISDKFKLEVRCREDSGWNMRGMETQPLAAENSTFKDFTGISNKENVEEIEKDWSFDSEFGPHFVEIAKLNNTLPKGFQLSRSNSLNDLYDSVCPQISNPNSEVQVTVVGTSPQIRKIQMQRQHERLAREKSWLHVPEEEESENNENNQQVASCTSRPKSSVTKSDNSSEEEFCLNLISSKSYKSIYEKMRMLEETTVIFFQAMGHRYTENMGATTFRTFGRHCKLHLLGFNHAMIDLIYIEVHRRWSYLSNYETKQGLCYQGFLEAFFRIAFARFVEQTKRAAVQSLIDHCKRSIGSQNFNWINTLYPTKDTLLDENTDSQGETKHLSVNKDRKQVPLGSPLSAKSSSPDVSESQASTKQSKSQKQSKYELMKAIQQMYKRKLRIPKSSKLEESNNSDSDSVKSLPSINRKKRFQTGTIKNTTSSRVNEALKYENSAYYKAGVFKTYNYETPGPFSLRREGLERGEHFVNISNLKKSNSFLPDSTLSTTSDLKPFKVTNKTLDKAENVQVVTDQRARKSIHNIPEGTHSINMRNNMKQLSPISNERMMKVISVYGGKHLLRSGNGVQRKYGVLKPL